MADTSSFTVMGLLGVGLGYGFGYEGIDEYYDYYNVIDRLFVEGFTQSRAFGLNLGSSTLASGIAEADFQILYLRSNVYVQEPSTLAVSTLASISAHCTKAP